MREPKVKRVSQDTVEYDDGFSVIIIRLRQEDVYGEAREERDAVLVEALHAAAREIAANPDYSRDRRASERRESAAKNGRDRDGDGDTDLVDLGLRAYGYLKDNQAISKAVGGLLGKKRR